MLRFLAIGCLVAALVEPARAGQATCSNPGVPAGAAQSSELLPGRLTFTLSMGLLPISSSEVLDDVSGQVRYDSHLTLVETRLGWEVVLSRFLAAGVSLPYRVVDVGVHYFDPLTGAPLQPTFAGIHARNETIHGLGDATVQVHGALSRFGFHFHARLGTTIPFGQTLDEDPFELGRIGQEHEHIQLGTGTLMPMIAVEVQRPFGPVTASAWGLSYLSLYENGSGYKPGSRISGGLTASSGLGSRELTFNAAAEVHGETAEKWHGVVPVDEGNAGRVDVFAGGSVAWRATQQLAVVADLKVPVYSHVSGNQLAYGVVAGFSFVGTFDLHHHASYRGLDEATVGPAGSATPVVPVAGKLTVFDLWADWCAPCRELDEKMVALARRYPDRIAVRKLEVIDADSAGWKAFLSPGNFALPHIKVYRPDGTLLFERTAPPADLARAVEDALR